MSNKKNKRQVRKTSASTQGVTPSVAPVADITPARTIDRDFNPDYSYVQERFEAHSRPGRDVFCHPDYLII